MDKTLYNYDVFIIKLIDELRNNKQITIENFTRGIVSKRNYSRYLNGDVKITFSILTKLLNRLNIPIADFSYYVANNIIVKHSYEIDFFELVFHENYKPAYDLYNLKMKDKQLFTHYREYAIPNAHHYLEYVLKIISVDSARIKMNNVIKLDDLLNKQIYTNDLIGALYFYNKIANTKEKEKIEKVLIDFLINKKQKNFSIQHEESNYFLYITFLEVVTTLNRDKEFVDKVISIALDFDRRARINLFDIKILRVLYNYANKVNYENKDIISFYYISSLIALKDNETIKNQTFNILKEDFDLYLQQISNDEIIHKELYEELINNDYL